MCPTFIFRTAVHSGYSSSEQRCVALFSPHLSHCAASSGASKTLWCFGPPLSRMQICTPAWTRRMHGLTACQTPPHEVSSVQLWGKKSLEYRFICQTNSVIVFGDLKWAPTAGYKMLFSFSNCSLVKCCRSRELVFSPQQRSPWIFVLKPNVDDALLPKSYIQISKELLYLRTT